MLDPSAPLSEASVADLREALRTKRRAEAPRVQMNLFVDLRLKEALFARAKQNGRRPSQELYEIWALAMAAEAAGLDPAALSLSAPASPEPPASPASPEPPKPAGVTAPAPLIVFGGPHTATRVGDR